MADWEKHSAIPAESSPIGEKEKDVSPPFGSDEDIGATFGVNEKALLRKLDFKLLPALTLLYLLSFLDRSNGKSLQSSIARRRY